MSSNPAEPQGGICERRTCRSQEKQSVCIRLGLPGSGSGRGLFASVRDAAHIALPQPVFQQDVLKSAR